MREAGMRTRRGALPLMRLCMSVPHACMKGSHIAIKGVLMSGLKSNDERLSRVCPVLLRL